jgi:hypothetical protein
MRRPRPGGLNKLFCVRTRGWRTATLAAGLSFLAGCSSGDVGDGLAREAVSGAVTLDGRPLDSASITFIPVDPNAPGGTSGEIQAGSYKIGSDRGPVAGSYKVAIATVPPSAAGSEPPPPGEAPKPKPDPIPARYNAKTTLTADIKAGGPNILDFALDAKK